MPDVYTSTKNKQSSVAILYCYLPTTCIKLCIPSCSVIIIILMTGIPSLPISVGGSFAPGSFHISGVPRVWVERLPGVWLSPVTNTSADWDGQALCLSQVTRCYCLLNDLWQMQYYTTWVIQLTLDSSRPGSPTNGFVS